MTTIKKLKITYFAENVLNNLQPLNNYVKDYEISSGSRFINAVIYLKVKSEDICNLFSVDMHLMYSHTDAAPRKRSSEQLTELTDLQALR